MGLVSEIFTDDVIARLKGDMAIGHTRYSTTGDSALLNAQPIRVESTKGLIAIAHNGNLVNLGNLRVHLERKGAFFQTTSDSEIIVQLIAHSQATTLVDAIADSLSQVEGAFSIVMMTRDRIFAARDPHGFRPLSMGRIHNPDGPDTVVFASETCAFDLLRAKFERDVLPGELVMVSADGVTSRQYAPPNQTSCIFEHVYFARPDSRIYNRWVQESREEMGRQLARESHVDADLVVPVPDSGVTAAIGYAAESGIPFRFGLIRNHYVGRTFIEPEQRVRDFGVKLKLNPVRNLLEGRRIILIDDSIIRGTTSRKIVRMVRQAGATEVHLRISCPPTISPCFYGVDTPRKSELIAANNTIEEIRRFIEADSLAYLSLDGLRNACDGGEGEQVLRRVLHGRVSDAVGGCRGHSAGGCGCGLGCRSTPDLANRPVFGGFRKIVLVLQVEPELCRVAEIETEAQGCVGGDAALAAHIVDAGRRDFEFAGQTPCGEAERLHELGFEDVPRVKRECLHGRRWSSRHFTTAP